MTSDPMGGCIIQSNVAFEDDEWDDAAADLRTMFGTQAPELPGLTIIQDGLVDVLESLGVETSEGVDGNGVQCLHVRPCRIDDVGTVRDAFSALFQYAYPFEPKHAAVVYVMGDDYSLECWMSRGGEMVVADVALVPKMRKKQR